MKQMTDHHSQTLTLLKYFAIFRHPLRLEEIRRFSCPVQRPELLQEELDALCASGAVRKAGDFYLSGLDESAIEKRLNGERKAAALLPAAKKVGRWLSLFPFVRMVGISGSLSKGYADDQTDFDYFIITAANTLWICRTILHVVKKLSFLAGRQHWFCMNYFIDEDHLELEERNIFTRIELSTMIPLCNLPLYRRFLVANSGNLPNLPNLVHADELSPARGPGRERNRFWQPLNKWLMRCTDFKWKRKWKRKGYPMEDYPLAFKTTLYISKNHPKNYQKMVLKQLEQESR